MRYSITIILLALLPVIPTAQADSLDGFIQRVYAKPARDEPALANALANRPLVFSAPPRESREESERLYRPIAEYLSRSLKRPVEYRYPGSWGAYRGQMLRDAYDLTFDEPHFSSYRAEKLGHRVLVKFPGTYQYAVIAAYDRTFTSIQRMAGQKFCTFAPPDLGTLVLLDLFDNPARQPSIISINSWEESYEGVLSGRCAAGVLPLSMLRWLDPEGRSTRILFNSTEMPGQALSAGTHVSPGERETIAKAMLAASAAVPTAALRLRWSIQRGFVPANAAEYTELSTYLRNELGFY
jgi:ABC-type phosphate/phosphonate transport system substrate-binding protein